MSHKKYDNIEKEFTELDMAVAELSGWYRALNNISTPPKINKPQRAMIEGLAFPILLHLEDLGVHPIGERENKENDKYYEWKDSQEDDET
jgi:hypothetical protein